MSRLAVWVMFSISVLAQTTNPPNSLDITLVSVTKMNVGEAYDCPSIDMQWHEAHCFTPTKENLNAPKHKYLVKATFDRPVEADKNGWLGTSLVGSTRTKRQPVVLTSKQNNLVA
jgi:hypothetical protein